MKKLLRALSLILVLSLVLGSISAVYADDGTTSSDSENGSANTVWFGSFFQNEETNEKTLQALSKATLTDGVAVLNGKRYAYKNKRYYKEAPIQWRIIKDNGVSYTLMSEKLLDSRALGGDITSSDNFWDTCSLRTWLNDGFYNTAFTEAEQESIIPSEVTFYKRTYDQWRTKQDGEELSVIDNVYILRNSEVADGMFGFSDDSSRVARATAYAGTEDAAMDWWLRGNGYWSYGNLSSYYVASSGSVTGWYPTYSKGVRPVIEVRKDSEGIYDEEPVDEDAFSRFVLGRDNNSYIHDYSNKAHSGFYGIGNHDMGPAYAAALATESDLGGTALALMLSAMKSEGWCYGIAATIALVHEGYLSVSDISSDSAASYFDMDPPCRNEKLKNTINYYFESQHRIKEQVGFFVNIPPGVIQGSQINISQAALDYKNFLKMMVQAAQEEDLIFAVPGHAILITGCVKNRDGTYTLQVYDENCVQDDCPQGEFGRIDIDLSRFQMEYTNWLGNVVMSTEKSENSELYFARTSALASASKAGIAVAKTRSVITIPRRKPIKIKSLSGEDLLSVTKEGIKAYNTPIYDLIPFLNDVAGEEHNENDEMVQVEIDKVDGIIVECESDDDVEVILRDSENAAQIRGKFSNLKLDMGDSINVDGNLSDYYVGMSSNGTTENGDKAIVTMTGSDISNLDIAADSPTTFDINSSDATDDTVVSYYDGNGFTEKKYSDKSDSDAPSGSTPAPVVNPVSPVTTSAEIIDLPAVKISKPAAAKKTAAVKWKKVSKKNLKKIKKVQIQYSMDKTFNTGVKTKFANPKKKSVKIKKLKSGKKYYVRIRAYKSIGGAVHVSKWSKVKTVKIK